MAGVRAPARRLETGEVYFFLLSNSQNGGKSVLKKTHVPGNEVYALWFAIPTEGNSGRRFES